MLLEKPQKLSRRLPAVVVSPETEEKLKALSVEYKLSVSEIVRRSIDLFLSEIATDGSNMSIGGRAS